jgi:hypothetical protein
MNGSSELMDFSGNLAFPYEDRWSLMSQHYEKKHETWAL